MQLTRLLLLIMMEGNEDTNLTCLSLSILSYNMHGYNQGSQTLRDLTLSIMPDIVMLQEHSLTPYASVRGHMVEATVPRGAMSTTVQYNKQCSNHRLCER